jgi:hypothetical protein
MACGPAHTPLVEDNQQSIQPSQPQLDSPLEVSYSKMANLLYYVEGISLWRKGMERAFYKAFDERFGMDLQDKSLLKKYSYIRFELEEAQAKTRASSSFDAPYGNEGLFPSIKAGKVVRYWQTVIGVASPVAVSRSLSGIVEPADAEVIAAVLNKFAPREEELVSGQGNFTKEVAELDRLLKTDQVTSVLESFRKFVGLDSSSWKFKVYPVWAPENSAFEATAYGDNILVRLPENKPIGPQQAALVVHEVGRQILARIPAVKKVLLTNRFVERAGYRGQVFIFLEGLLDSLSHGVLAPLIASGPEEIPAWPGDKQRKKYAEIMTPLLKNALGQPNGLNVGFILKAADAYLQVSSVRPFDYLHGAMVVAEDHVLEAFKSQVMRWTVWKFPPSKKYNYKRKLENNPGKSMLLLLAPSDIKRLSLRFSNVEVIASAIKDAGSYLKRDKAVIITIPRQSRGYFFVLAARNPDAMKKVAKTFFKLDSVPGQPVVVD